MLIKFHLHIKAVALTLLLVSSAHGQWRMLNDFGAQIYSIHFLDREGFPQIGFVGLTTGAVWRTSDGGATWLKTNTPANLIGAVKEFTFKDSLTGWLVANQSTSFPGCYKTTDAGISWTGLSPLGQYTAIYYNSKTQALVLSGWNGAGASVSLDLGQTWTGTGNTANACGYAFTDSLNGIMSIFPANLGGNYSVTIDGGLTWQNLTQTLEAWQPLAIKGTNTYFICAEGVRQILRSDDKGKTWNVIHSFPSTLDLSGDIRGDLNALYIQSKLGTFYSVDQGVSWTNYCGPVNDFDTRMYLIGEDSLYAGTLDGQLWLNPFGVKKNNELLQFSKSPMDFISNGCQSVDSIFRFLNLSNCLAVKLLNVSIIQGVGSKNFSFKKPIFPITIPDSGNYAIDITYTPDNSTADSTQIDIQYSVGGQVFEIKQWLRGFVRPGFNVLLSKDLNLFLEHSCGQIDTFITIKSGLCGADTVLAEKITATPAFSINPPLFPAAIPAGGSLQISLSALSTVPIGVYNATLTFTILSGGITRDTSVNLTLTILSNNQTRTNLLPGFAKFDTVSICSVAYDTIIVKNTLCDILSIDSGRIQPPSATSQFSFSVLNKTLPDPLKQNGGLDTIIIEYKPTVGGAVAGSLVLTIELSSSDVRDTIIPITGIGKALAGSALGSNLLAFASIEPCTTQDLSTQLYNNSCGTDTVVAIIPAKDQSFSAISPAPPLAIISGDSSLIKIQEDPPSAGAKFDSVGVVLHSSSGATDTVYLKVSGIVNKPVHKLSLDAALQLDSLAPCTQFDTILELKNLGICDTLSIDSASLSGPNWFTLGTLPVSRTILPGGNFFVTIHFTLGAGATGAGSLHLKGVGIDTIISVVANSRKGGVLFSITNDGIVFTSSLCKPASHTFTFQNTSCDTIILDQLSLKNNAAGGSQFSFTPAVGLPDTIAPGKKLDIIVQFNPLGTGDSLATLTYHSTLNNFSNTTNLSGKLASSRQTAGLELMIGANGKLIALQAGAPVTVRLLLQNDVGDSLGLKSTKVTLAYYNDVLGNPNPVAGAGWIVNSATSGNGSYTLDLSRTNTNSLIGGSEMATVQFDTYVTDSSSTPMDLQNISFNNGDAIFASCVLAPQALSPVRIEIDSECGTTVLRGYLNHDNTIFSGISIRPNPVPSGTQIKVDLQMNERADLNMVLSDALGQIISEITKPMLPAGLQNILLDLPKNASGFYILSIEAGGMKESRKIVIEK